MTKQGPADYALLTNEEGKSSGDEDCGYDAQSFSPKLAENVNAKAAKIDKEIDLEGREESTVWWYKVRKTLALTFLLTSLALYGCLISPTTPDLRQRIGLTMEEFSRSRVAGSLGSIMGAIVGGLLFDKCSRYSDCIIAMSAAIAGVTAILVPWSGSLPMFALLSLIVGAGHGMFTSAGNSMLLSLWGSNPVPMYIFHLGWTVGCPLSPLLAQPFLSPDSDTPSNEHCLPNCTNITLLDTNTTSNINASALPWWEYGDTSKVELPYALSGLLQLVCVPIFIMYQLRKPPPGYKGLHRSKNTWAEVFSLGSCSQGAKGFSLQIIISILLYYVFYIGAVKADGSLMFSFVIERRNHLDFTKGEATHMDSVSRFFHLFGRIVAIIVSNWVPIRFILGMSILGTALSLTGVSVIGIHNGTMLWIFLSANEFFTASIWSGAYTWAETYIKVSALMIGLWDVGANVSGMMFSWLDGIIFDTDHPEYTFYIGTVFGWVFVLHFLLIEITASMYVRRSKQKGKDGEAGALLSDEEVDFDKEELEMLNTGDNLRTESDHIHSE